MTDTKDVNISVGEPLSASAAAKETSGKVLKMFSSAGESDEVDKKIEELISKTAPSGTDTYTAAQLMCVPNTLKLKHDFETGSKRNPRWGMVFSFNILPELHKYPPGPIMLPTAPAQFIASDDLEKIKERIMFELDRAMELSKIAEEDPEGYEKYERALIRRATAHVEEDDGC